MIRRINAQNKSHVKGAVDLQILKPEEEDAIVRVVKSGWHTATTAGAFLSPPPRIATVRAMAETLFS